MHPNKRKNKRYCHTGLNISVARKGIVGFLKFNPQSECVDFSLSGLQFSSSQAFTADDKLVVDLCIADVELCEINAIVANCEEARPGLFRTGVKFCFSAKRMKKPQIIHALLQIEDRLRISTEYPEQVLPSIRDQNNIQVNI